MQGPGDVTGGFFGSAAPGGAPLPSREPTPWERRREVGLLRGLWETWRWTMFDPDGFWRSVDPARPPSDALFYGWIVAAIGAAVAAPFQALQLGAQGVQMREVFSDESDLPAQMEEILEAIFQPSGILALSLGFAIVSVVLYPLFIVILSGIIHLFCLLFGCAKHGFPATLRIVAYASAPTVLQGIPCLGFAALAYTIVLQVWGVMRVQETSGGRAAGAVLALPVVLCCGCGGVGLAGVLAMMSSTMR
jgi:hypothetical protein